MHVFCGNSKYRLRSSASVCCYNLKTQPKNYRMKLIYYEIYKSKLLAMKLKRSVLNSKVMQWILCKNRNYNNCKVNINFLLAVLCEQVTHRYSSTKNVKSSINWQWLPWANIKCCALVAFVFKYNSIFGTLFWNNNSWAKNVMDKEIFLTVIRKLK